MINLRCIRRTSSLTFDISIAVDPKKLAPPVPASFITGTAAAPAVTDCEEALTVAVRAPLSTIDPGLSGVFVPVYPLQQHQTLVQPQ